MKILETSLQKHLFLCRKNEKIMTALQPISCNFSYVEQLHFLDLGECFRMNVYLQNERSYRWDRTLRGLSPKLSISVSCHLFCNSYKNRTWDEIHPKISHSLSSVIWKRIFKGTEQSNTSPRTILLNELLTSLRDSSKIRRCHRRDEINEHLKNLFIDEMKLKRFYVRLYG